MPNNTYQQLIEQYLVKEAQKLLATLAFGTITNNQLKQALKQSLNDLFKFNDTIFTNIKKEIDETFIYYPSDVDALNLEIVINYYHNKQILNEELYTFYNHWIQNKMTHNILSDVRLWLDKTIEQTYLLKYFKLFDDIRSRFVRELQDQINYWQQNQQTASTMHDLFGHFWDISASHLKTIDINLVKQLQQTLDEKRFISQIAELLGRLAHNYQTYDEVKVKEPIYQPSNKQAFYAPENLASIKLGNELNSLLKYQLNLRHKPNTKKLFQLQYIERKLLHFDYYAKWLDETLVNRTTKALVNDSKGPFIICVDTSGSMIGEPEIIAKAFTLAITKIARQQNRKCYVILFSTDLMEFDTINIKQQFSQFYQFLSMSFQGGTDIVLAMDRAVNKCKENDYHNADIIVVSDFIITSLTDKLRIEIDNLKRKRVRFNAFSIGKSQIESKIDYFDHNWIYDGTQASIDNIINDLVKITRK